MGSKLVEELEAVRDVHRVRAGKYAVDTAGGRYTVRFDGESWTVVTPDGAHVWVDVTRERAIRSVDRIEVKRQEMAQQERDAAAVAEGYADAEDKSRAEMFGLRLLMRAESAHKAIGTITDAIERHPGGRVVYEMGWYAEAFVVAEQELEWIKQLWDDIGSGTPWREARDKLAGTLREALVGGDSSVEDRSTSNSSRFVANARRHAMQDAVGRFGWLYW